MRQKELEENNERFVKHENDMKRELRNIDPLAWSTEEYEFMARRDEDLLTLNEFATVRLFLFNIYLRHYTHIHCCCVLLYI